MRHPDVAKFISKVMGRTGAKNPTDLSKQLGGDWTGRDQQRKLYKWAAGETAPNYYGTIALLRVAGMLTEGASTTRPQRSLDENAVLQALEDLADLQERQDELLFGLLDREVAQRPPRPARKRKRAS